MKFAGFLIAFSGNMKQSSGLCVPFLMQWGGSVSSLWPRLFFTPVLPGFTFTFTFTVLGLDPVVKLAW